jgi:hypothetical protein
MPLFLILFGVLLMIAALRNKLDDLTAVLKDDFTGANNYFVWVLAIGLIVALGNIDDLKPVSNAFLTLVIVIILLANRGLLPSFIEQVKRGTGADLTSPVKSANNVSIAAKSLLEKYA